MVSSDALVYLDDNSPCARQLKQGFRLLRFQGELEQEYLASLRADQRWSAMVCGWVSIVIWALFGLSDVFRLNLIHDFPNLAADTWLILAARWAGAGALLACLCLGKRPDFTQRVGTLACTSVMAMALSGAFTANLYELKHLTQGGIVQLVFVMAAFFPLGVTFYESVALALLVIISSAGLSVAMLPPELMPDHVRLCGMMLLTTGLTATSGYLREKAHREQFLLRGILKFQATRDPLTGLHNRRSLEDHFDLVRRQAQRSGASLAYMVIDIDHFKQYNDHHGHHVGDLALKDIAQCLAGFARRPLDRVFRLGGEEFALLLHDCPDGQLQLIAERLRAQVQALGIAHGRSDTAASVTVSIGAVLGLAHEGLREIYQRADALLYESKRAGRNRVTVAMAMPAPVS